jgi:hypothetical protein
MPKAADGMSETSKPTSGSAPARLTRGRGIVNGRVSPFKQYCTPFATSDMYVDNHGPVSRPHNGRSPLRLRPNLYTRSETQRTKAPREADGGQISWHKESMRRHGTRERIDDDKGTFGEALMGDLRKKKQQKGEENVKAPVERSNNDAELRKIMGKKD